MQFASIVSAIAGGVVATTAFLWLFSKQRLSALYWLSLLAVFSIPAVQDVLVGLPPEVYEGVNWAYCPFAEQGVPDATLFALGHILVSFATQVSVAKLLGRTRRAAQFGQTWLLESATPRRVLLVVFLAASAVILWNRRDLSRQFNDFLKDDAPAEYEMYFLLCATPLMAILAEQSPKRLMLCWFVALWSVVVAYFIGIRYYTFPYLGYYVWQLLSNARLSYPKRLVLAGSTLAVAWVGLTVWGIVRGLGVRAEPLAVLERESMDSLTRKVALGNELGARIAYYDLVGRMGEGEFRGSEALVATVASAVYPMIMRQFDLEAPLSNSKRIFELQSGIVGSGISTGATVFGNDWFTWGWWGVLVGGLLLGIVLGCVDHLQATKSAAWYLLGPMATFQLIFFARGGTDVWLGIWGRFLPLSLSFLGAAWLLDRILALPHAKRASPGLPVESRS